MSAIFHLTESTSEVSWHLGVEEWVEAGIGVGQHMGHYLGSGVVWEMCGRLSTALTGAHFGPKTGYTSESLFKQARCKIIMCVLYYSVIDGFSLFIFLQKTYQKSLSNQDGLE